MNGRTVREVAAFQRGEVGREGGCDGGEGAAATLSSRLAPRWEEPAPSAAAILSAACARRDDFGLRCRRGQARRALRRLRFQTGRINQPGGTGSGVRVV